MASSPPQLLKRQHEEEENDRKTRQRRDSLSPEPTKHPTFMPFPDLLNPNARQRQIPFQLPSQLLTFSYTPEHVQVFDNSALRYYVDPPVGANLSYGYERWIRRPDERGRLDALLKAVVKIKEDTSKAGAALPHIGVVAWRGIITKIMTAPYEERDSWELNVMRVDGTLYLEEHLTNEKLREKNNMNPRQRSQTYYGYAFESYCTRDQVQLTSGRNHGDAPGWGGDVDTNVQWCSVVRTKLGDTRMIIGGEVDCVRGKYTGQTDTFVELKTSMTIRNAQDEARFERKLLKFYFQSFLLGVPEIVVGFRTPAGIVQTIQRFKTMELPRLVRGKTSGWDPVLCMDWCGRFLDLLHGNVDDGVWRAKFEPKHGVTLTALGPEDTADVSNGEERTGFLPTWYMASIRGQGT